MISNKTDVGYSGPKTARVIGHDTSQGAGTLFVTIEGYDPSVYGSDVSYVPAYYAPPFFGYTNRSFNGQNTGNSNAYNDTQKSYGMSFVPPDVGTKVLVVQTQDSKRWYWIGVIPEVGSNHMVPGIAAAGNVDMSPEQQAEYGQTTVLPVAEVNSSLDSSEAKNFADRNKRPIHPLAGFLLDSGLVGDPIRGSHTSTMTRTAISNVYGISTPGPIDKRPGATKKSLGTTTDIRDPEFVSRLGGHQFVMDDGDERFLRKTPADQGPPEYADTTKDETDGDVRIPYGESFRLRTRTGHQILLHNSEDIIYIGNSRGTGWIEISSDGKIDIFAQDSVSIHTNQDFNFHAGRDINMEADRNINIKATGKNTESISEEGKLPSNSGRIHIDSAGNLTTLVGGFKSTLVKEDVSTTIQGNERTNVEGNIEITVSKDYKLKASNVNTTSIKNTRIRSNDSTNISSKNFHRETANKIEMNCDPAQVAESGSLVNVTVPEPLSTHLNSVTDITLPWANKEYQSDEGLESIMKRIPQHEPWYKHENNDPLSVAPTKTDRDIEEENG